MLGQTHDNRTPKDKMYIPSGVVNRNLVGPNLNTSSIDNDANAIINRIALIKSIMDKAQTITITVLSSSTFQVGTKIKIGPLGLLQPLQNHNIQNDGFVYFGYSPNLIHQDRIDVQILSSESPYLIGDNKQNMIGRYFQISFNPETLKYYIRDCGYGYGTFIQVQSETILKDGSLLSIGNTCLSVSIGFEDETFLSEGQPNLGKKIPTQPNKDYNNLNLKIISNVSTYDPMNFQPTKSAIRIGRSNDCEVVVEDSTLSRVHCTIEYRYNVGWVIRDGMITEGKDGSVTAKPSINGTWIYALEDNAIYEGMKIKSCENLFQVSFDS